MNKKSAEEILGTIIFEGLHYSIGKPAFYIGLKSKLGNIQEIIPYQTDNDYEDGKREIIYHFIDHDIYLKFKGHESSYNTSTDWSFYPEIVKPLTKTITLFEKQ